MSKKPILETEITLTTEQYELLGTATTELVEVVKGAVDILERAEREEPTTIAEINALFMTTRIANGKIGTVTLEQEVEAYSRNRKLNLKAKDKEKHNGNRC